MYKNSCVLCLLAVEVFEISNKYIFELRESHKNADEVFDILPEFIINTNEGAGNQIITARYFHQFMGSFAEEQLQKVLVF